MKIVIAPDSFKESMSAFKASQAIQKGIWDYDSSIKTMIAPMADGGEGTLETLVKAMGGQKEYYEVTGVLFQKIQAPIGYVHDIAIIECAKVCGLELLDEEKRDPYLTTTYGLGELMLHALDHGAKQLLICLGGSATNDGGIGMLSALGVQFSCHGKDIPLTMAGLSQITDICFDDIDSRIMKVSIIGVCDVKNPLCGKNGATAIYGPQKGVHQEDIQKIDKAMQEYASKIDTHFKCNYASFRGAGAAGGLGYALLGVCHAQLKSGFDVVSQAQSLERAIRESDCVIVGEGKIDRQTQFGKTPYGVLKLAQKYHKPVFAFAGRIEDEKILKELGFINVYEISPRDISLSVALKNGQDFLRKCVYEHMEDIRSEI